VTRHGRGIAFDFAIPPERLPLMQRLAFQAMAANVRAAGEPWKAFFDPDTLSASLRRLGFAIAHVATTAAINARYFAGRADKLAVGGPGPGVRSWFDPFAGPGLGLTTPRPDPAAGQTKT